MPQSGPSSSPELSAARDHFIAELGNRLEALRQGLHRIPDAVNATAEVYAVKRRLHALAAGARVLGFGVAAETLTQAEAQLGSTAASTSGSAAARSTTAGVPSTAVLVHLDQVLDALPTLVLGGNVSVPRLAEGAPTGFGYAPLTLVLYGDSALEHALKDPSDGPFEGLEIHASQNPTEVLRLVGTLSPDVVLCDGDFSQTAELVPRLQQALGPLPVVLIAAGTFERHAELVRLIELGVSRLLPKPVSASTLRRVIRQAAQRPAPSAPARPEAFRRLTLEALAAHIADDAHRLLVEGSAGRHAQTIDFGSGTELLAELWSAFARIRDLAEQHAQGSLRLPAFGPNLALACAPVSSHAARGTTQLAERRILVVDSDPDVAHFLRGVLEAAGAVVLGASDGAVALRLARRRWPDAIVSAVQMPGLDGFELCRRIKQDIVLGDVPLLLVTWRTELERLARAARRRAEAPPESSAPPETPRSQALSLLGDLATALGPRTWLEQRLSQLREVHGRLDGITPRLLLQLVCKARPDATLTIRSAGLYYELHLQGGQLVSAVLSDSARELARGQAVLAPLLGARSGRFTVEQLVAPAERDFDAGLMPLLEPTAARARAAQQVFAQGPLEPIERVVLEPHAVTQYLFSSTNAVRSLVTQLVDGAAPRSLTLKAYSTREPLRTVIESTLSELCQRGAVLAVLDADGADWIERVLGNPEPPSSVARASVPVAARLTPVPPIVLRATRAEMARAELGAQRASRDNPARDSQRPDPRRLEQPNAAAPPQELELGAAVLAALSHSPEPAPVARVSTPPFSGAVLRDPTPPQAAAGERSSGAFEASRRISTPPMPAARLTQPPAADGEALDPLAVTVERPAITEALLASAKLLPVRPAIAVPHGTPAEFELDAAPAVQATDEAASALGADERQDDERLGDAQQDDARQDDAQQDDAQQDDARESSPEPSAASDLREPAAKRAALVAAPGGPPSPTDSAASEADELEPAPGSVRWHDRFASAFLAVSVAAAAAALAYFGLQQLTPRAGQGVSSTTSSLVAAAPPLSASPAPDAGVPAALPKATQAPVAPEFRSEQLALPTDVTLNPGHGLLEIRAGRRQRLYVDGVFVGNYASRRVPLKPGTYEVRLMDGAHELKRPVEIIGGQRTLLSVVGQPAP